jgi:formamidopyrimidine-DNA glycosylase
MPELPEVETIRLFLEQNLINKTIKKIEILTPKSFLDNPKLAEGQKIISFSRLGKQLSFHLANKTILHLHLKMTGQLIYISAAKTILGHPTKNMFDQSLPNKSTRVIFYFSSPSVGKSGKSTLYFNDQRKFGWVKIFTKDELTEFQKDLGLDILDPSFSPAYFYSQLQTSRRPIKTVLLDQSKFAGIGNIYANDALFLAKINPVVPSKNLSQNKSIQLHSAVVKVIKESISHGGSTARDNKYVRPDGSFGGHQYHFYVYQKEGQPCPVCQTIIKRQKLSGRSVFYCPECQK